LHLESIRQSAPEDESAIDIRKILRLCKKYWYGILLSVVIAGGFAFAYMRYTAPAYQTTLRLLIKDGNSTGQYSETEILNELGLRPAAKNYENEILILRSAPLMAQIAESLHLQFDYWMKGRLRITNLYLNSPIEVAEWEPATQDFIPFTLEVQDKGDNAYDATMGETIFRGEYGKTTMLSNGQIMLTRIPSRNSAEGRSIFIKIKSVEDVARDLSLRVDATLTNRFTTILLISLVDPVPQRAEDILNVLARVYSEMEIRDRNQIYEKTLQFIDERLQLLAGDLTGGESAFQAETTPLPSLSLDTKSGVIQAEVMQNNKELVEWETQSQILDALEQSLFAQPDSFGFIPTNIISTNAALNSMINRLNELQLEHGKLASTLGPNHPNLQMLEKQLKNMRSNILGNIAILKKELEAKRNSIDNRRRSIRQTITSIPQNEIEISDVTLQQKIKQNLYLFLLQKKEETALKLAATVSSRVVVEDAYSDKSIVKPNELIVYRNALAAGLALPMLLLIIIGIARDRIEQVEDIKKITKVPITGSILQGKKRLRMVIKEKSRSAMAELFRLLRTNLHFVSPDTKNQVFLFTSIMPGEGKTFICLNLAITMAMAKKKTIILELDLRKPKLAEYIGLKESVLKGLTQYLADAATTVEEIIQPSELHPNLYLISSGPIPPDPGELILSDRLKELLKTLRSQFDIILIDSSPVGLVADTFLLKHLVDTTIFITRQNVTRKGHVKMIDEIFRHEKLPRPQIVFNGVKYENNTYGYGYASKNGYYHAD
jgi:tyrosine-protein kinase Etk/Wzc